MRQTKRKLIRLPDELAADFTAPTFNRRIIWIWAKARSIYEALVFLHELKFAATESATEKMFIDLQMMI
jgi:hypothetical protein